MLATYRENMSIPVDLDRLAEALTEYRFAYLLTTGDDLRPHAVMATPKLHDGHLHVSSPGRHTSANVAARPTIALVWPPERDTGYSLIVDADATIQDDALRAKPTRALFHRSAAPETTSTPGVCESDCVELDATP